MTMLRFFQRGQSTLWMLLAIGTLFQSVHAAAQPYEIHEVNRNPAEFTGRSIRVEGRFRSAGAGKMYLVDSPIEFRLGQYARAIRRGLTHVEVRGTLSHVGDRWLFDVAYLTKKDREAKQFATRRAQITDGNIAAIEELAAWARRRAQWYHDPQLTYLAADATRQAVAWKEAELAAVGDALGLMTLAARAELMLAAPREIQRVRHRAIWLRYERLRPNDIESRESLIQLVRQLLPGSQSPASLSPDLAAAYDASPIDTYASTDVPDQRMLHRALYCRLVVEALNLKAKRPDAELQVLAEYADKALPDRPSIAAELHLAALEQRARQIARLSRSDVLALREGFRQWNQPARGETLLVAWLDGRRARLASDEVEQRISLATDYRELAHQNKVAARLLIEAWDLAPDVDEVRSGLTELGYELRSGVWHAVATATEAPLSSETDDELWLTEGASEIELLRRLRRPDRVARVATQGEIVEQWIYEGPPRLVVYVSRSTASGLGRIVRLAAP